MSSGRIHDDEPAQKPSGWKNCMNFLYNSETGQVIGRTWKSWGLIGLFYLIYYAALAGFFAVCLGVFLHTLDNDAPRQQHMYSPLKSTPGMGFRPKLSTSESSLIKFTANDSKTYNEYIQNLEHTLEEFTNQKGENVIDCNTTDGFDQPSSGDVCSYPLRLLGEECTSEKQFGFNTGRPCILLKINRVYDWQPKPFSEERLNDTTDAFAQEAKQLLGDRLLNDYVGISCEGENDADKDNIRSSAFYPNNGLPYAFFPYRNQPNYVSPVAMVQFDVVPGRLVMIWCKLWASDLKHNRNDLQGSVHFELLVDNKQAQQF